jgi:beta-lactamase class A
MMRRSLQLLFISALVFSCGQRDAGRALEENIKAELGRQRGVFAVAFKDLTTGHGVLINEREVFHAASTMKTPVMIEAFKQAAAGRFSLQDSVVIKNVFRSIADSSAYSLGADGDSEQQLYLQVGKKKTIAALVYDMIIVSSNLATNNVIALVDAKNVMQTMREIGANDIQVLRGVEDSKAFQKGLNNTTTAYDLMLIFEKIAREEMVSKAASKAMTGILLDQRFKDIIPARLPANVKVAHKTGSITGVRHDSGIVMLPDGRKYVLVILSKNLEDEDASVNAMAAV